MTKDERIEAKPDIVKWFLGDFFPGGLERSFLWDSRTGVFGTLESYLGLLHIEEVKADKNP